MFITLTPLTRGEPKRPLARLRRRIADRLRPPEPVIRRVELLDAAFIDIRARLSGGEFAPGWQGSARLTCRHALCPPGCCLPPGCLYAVTQDDVRGVTARILCNTAAALLQESRLPLYCRCAGLIDPACAHPELLEELVKQVPEVIVHTENLALYQGYAAKILEEYGAPVTFAGGIEALRRCTLVLHTGGEADLSPLGGVPVLCAAAPPGAPALTDPAFSLPAADEYLPPGIDPAEFYTALRVRCGISRIDRLCARSLCCDGVRLPLPEIAAQIRLARKQALQVG